MDQVQLNVPKAPTLKRLPVMELFGPTIQGEGTLAGTQTMFIRFGLCDYKCTMCDSIHAINPQYVNAHAMRLTIDEILNETSRTSTVEWFTISGGNPAIHDLTELVLGLKRQGYKVAVETQGTKSPSWLHLVDGLTVSPKSPGMGEAFEAEVFHDFMARFGQHPQLCIKVPVFSAQDLEFAVGIQEIVNTYNKRDDIFYLSLGNPYPPPLPGLEKQNDTGFDLVQTLIGNYKVMLQEIQQDLRLRNWRFLPQLHVWLWGNEKGR
jgi:7-carboxy-7-deazaguanine synthase